MTTRPMDEKKPAYAGACTSLLGSSATLDDLEKLATQPIHGCRLIVRVRLVAERSRGVLGHYKKIASQQAIDAPRSQPWRLMSKQINIGIAQPKIDPSTGTLSSLKKRVSYTIYSGIPLAASSETELAVAAKPKTDDCNNKAEKCAVVLDPCLNCLQSVGEPHTSSGEVLLGVVGGALAISLFARWLGGWIWWNLGEGAFYTVLAGASLWVAHLILVGAQ